MPSSPDIAEFRVAGHAAVDLVADYLAALPGQPVFRPMEATDRRRLAEQALPVSPVSLQDLLGTCAADLMAHPMGNGHPRFFGWVNSPPELGGVLGALVAAAIDPSCAGGDHAATYLEQACVRWLAGLAGYPLEQGTGCLTSGASMASILCLSAARTWAARQQGWDVREDGLQAALRAPLVLYVSSETHSCVRKAAELLGIGHRFVRTVPADAAGRMDVPVLTRMLAADRDRGHAPFCVVGTAGTTATGAVDPLDHLADLAAAEGLWFHVDGAYGAFGVLDPAVAADFGGMERADSLAIDPHKWLRVPVDCGCALVRRAGDLRDAFSLVPAYLRTEEGRGFGGPTWFSEFTLEQTRPYRALRCWMTLAHTGRVGVIDSVVRCQRLARLLATWIERSDDLELLAPVETSVVAFRYVGREAASPEALDGLNRAIIAAVQEAGQCFITGALVGGREALRACFLNPETTEGDLDVVLREVRRAAGTLLAADGGSPSH